MVLFNTGILALVENTQVGLVVFLLIISQRSSYQVWGEGIYNQALSCLTDVGDQSVQKIEAHTLSYDDSEDLGLIFVWWEWV